MEIKKEELLTQIKKAKKGSQSAFNILLDTFWSSVYAFLLKKVHNDNDAEDITIQTFSKAFDRIETFDEKYQFKTWLISISKNVHIDYLRKKKSSNSIETTKEQEDEVYTVMDDALSPEDKLITEQNLAKLLKDIKKLKPKYQEVINLRYFQELSYKEISEHIKEPMNNVKVKLLRARKLLAEIIKN
ncbi:RNA polymerase sigma-70 factor (ECF subfamily) [Lutibacter sp. Hel_I_33_5]|uniref:RNA polymerase sigma factor n=1 Tax=Lutibacter sp. Hel_I_33_5 TaxID=1566289 RepID=UPI0011A3EF90|nr:sigma-70 family RNA polymerase sigma factor [Lutibacter sp. Hel_I_33_5]TVZ55336.1 RNA polymerase sigma-70 factor (ECF subfamily) [Lutibacter sp. Hel_I_33_5]